MKIKGIDGGVLWFACVKNWIVVKWGVWAFGGMCFVLDYYLFRCFAMKFAQCHCCVIFVGS